MRPLLSILIAIALPAVLAAAEPLAWRVVSVHDGDTLTALDAANVQHKVRLAVARARRPEDHARRLTAAAEHLEGWADATVRTLHEGERASFVLVCPRRPVRAQAAKDIATTCQYYVEATFKSGGGLNPAHGEV